MKAAPEPAAARWSALLCLTLFCELLGCTKEPIDEQAQRLRDEQVQRLKNADRGRFHRLTVTSGCAA